jgi:serine/threonine-protein kinase HipA
MTSSAAAEAFVWVWLPGADDPVVTGRLTRDGEVYLFNYGRTYLERPEAMALYDVELPLGAGPIAPLPPLTLANCLRDAAPDSWGRRVIVNRLTGLIGDQASAVELDELTFLLESGSNRVGALDFQASPTEYVPRVAETASLDELSASADRVEQGVPLTPALALALQHGTAVGGARPKALIDGDNHSFIAKFSSSTDTFNVVKAEFIAMRLARAMGLDTAGVELTQALHKDVLLVERFDRIPTDHGQARRLLLSALTLLGLHELAAAHASYADLAELIRQRFSAPKDTLRELFARLTCNILVGNTDDHARNHAAFWDGATLSLAPAYDVCPQTRAGYEASQGMLIHGTVRRSQLAHCIDSAHHYLLHHDDALALVSQQIQTLRERWDDLSREAGLSDVDKTLLWRRQFLNPLAVEGLEPALAAVLTDL